MGKITFGKKETVSEKTAKINKKHSGTLGSSKGTVKPPKATVSFKGTNPIKKKVVVTWKKDL